jgi:iron complex transport system permease protein
MPPIIALARPLRLLEMGDDAASALGVRVERTRMVPVITAVLLGALLMVAADFLAQWGFSDRELPVGAVTGMLGGVYLLWLLVTERRAGRI